MSSCNINIYYTTPNANTTKSIEEKKAKNKKNIDNNNPDDHNKIKHINLTTNTITASSENNLSNLGLNFSTFKTISDTVNIKLNSNKNRTNVD